MMMMMMMMMIMLMREMMDKNRIIIHETDGNLYHKKDLAASFLSNQETLLSTVGKPEDDIMNSVLKQFSDFCNQDNEIRGELASNDETM